MDSDMGAAVPVQGLRPHDEPVAGLVASVAVVCGGGHHRSALPEFNFWRDGPRDRRPLRKKQ